MSITHVSTVTIHVSDQDKALEFYVNKLGFEVREDAPFGENTDLRWIEVAPPGAHTGMVLAKGYGGWTPESVGGFAGIVFESNNIQATYEESVRPWRHLHRTPNDAALGHDASSLPGPGRQSLRPHCGTALHTASTAKWFAKIIRLA